MQNFTFFLSYWNHSLVGWRYSDSKCWRLPCCTSDHFGWWQHNTSSTYTWFQAQYTPWVFFLSHIFFMEYLYMTFYLPFLLLTEEAERIVQCKGRVFCLDDEPGVHRVWLPNVESPGLAMSRAFGDYCVKDFGLISVPEVTQRQLNTRDQFIILATDGVRFVRKLFTF